MSEDFIVELLLEVQSTMLSDLKAKTDGLSLEDCIQAITETDEYTYLRFYDSKIDTDEYIINFIRFISRYTVNPEKIARMFVTLIYNIKRVSCLFQDPALQFMVNPTMTNFLMGYFLKSNPNIIHNNAQENKWH